MSITIFQGSILDVEADCIVNPANSHLAHGGGLARIIAQSAAPLRQYEGKRIGMAHYSPAESLTRAEFARFQADYRWQQEQDAHPLIPTGGAGWTSAGRLPYKGIIHAVGPVWGGGAYLEDSLLAKAHFYATSMAAEHNCKSIVFPAISCGIFGYPVECAAPTAIRAVRAGCLYWPMDVTFALFEDAHVAAYTEALRAVDSERNAITIQEVTNV